MNTQSPNPYRAPALAGENHPSGSGSALVNILIRSLFMYGALFSIMIIVLNATSVLRSLPLALRLAPGVGLNALELCTLATLVVAFRSRIWATALVLLCLASIISTLAFFAGGDYAPLTLFIRTLSAFLFGLALLRLNVQASKVRWCLRLAAILFAATPVLVESLRFTVAKFLGATFGLAFPSSIIAAHEALKAVLSACLLVLFFTIDFRHISYGPSQTHQGRGADGG